MASQKEVQELVDPALTIDGLVSKSGTPKNRRFPLVSIIKPPPKGPPAKKDTPISAGQLFRRRRISHKPKGSHPGPRAVAVIRYAQRPSEGFLQKPRAAGKAQGSKASKKRGDTGSCAPMLTMIRTKSAKVQCLGLSSEKRKKNTIYIYMCIYIYMITRNS